ncbi:transient receptor potential cation channel trpm-like isoform X2 [Artemia franciscana]|uniref:transient receptor potential cation channel trpm-like isoform X2 n=1 Tax=Artemia franciscana TaxID=6661 RepID=UPI0032DBDE23
MVDANHKSLEAVFFKRECQLFIPSIKDPNRCGCGDILLVHQTKKIPVTEQIQEWSPDKHTLTSPTDAFGVIEFQGGAHPSKAQYIRLSYDTRPEAILQLLLKRWMLELPKLVISVHGGKANFELPSRLDSILKKGLLKAAKTTGAWLLTSGTNTGVTRHVGDALSSERSPRLRPGRVVSIGIVPWGIVENRQSLVGKGKDVPYMSIDKPRSHLAALNNRHSYFLLVDDGSVGRYGAEIELRRKLGRIISGQRLPSRTPCNVPMVCLVVEGGIHTIRKVLEYVSEKPPVPVVVLEGSGRAADLLAFAYRYIDENGDSTLLDSLREQMTTTIAKTFRVDMEKAKVLYFEILQCVKKKNLITIFQGDEPVETSGENAEELDLAILTALFRSRHLSVPEQLSLALAWNRTDLARREIFIYGQNWPEGALDEAMMEALANNRVDFVKLLLEKGVSMSRFITIPRLEQLYNAKTGPANTLGYLVADIRPHMPRNYHFTLLDIGLVINQLMGGTYKSSYSSRKFREVYHQVMKQQYAHHLIKSSVRTPNTSLKAVETLTEDLESEDVIFTFPFNELLVWAVLTKRQSMAILMWQHGEEALAKSLIASCLYKAMAKEAADDDLEAEVCEELKKYSAEFESLGLELLDYCYRQDDDMTLQLLTCALPHWGRQTCLYLAVLCNFKPMLSHPSAQILLADLWMGGLRTRKSPNLKVLLGLLFPPAILTLQFKSKEELLLMPQTEEEHLYEIEEEEAPSETSSFLDLHNANSKTDNEGYSKGEEGQNGSPYLDSSCDQQLDQKHRKQLESKKKIYEFYGAPITKFMAHSMAYIAFLMIYTYTVLIRSLPSPEWNEYFVFTYLAIFGIEKIREIIDIDAPNVLKKIKVWRTSAWNIGDTIGIVTFMIGFYLRHIPEILAESRVIYSVNIVFWYVRILRILMVSKLLGPFVTLIGKFAYTMAYFVILLVVFLLGYGVFRQSLLYPNNEPNWLSARNVTFQPYFMIYGELFAEEIDAPCGEVGEDPCVPGRWLNPIFMTVYLLMAIILLLNMLIAIFNSIFIRTNAIAHQVWMFHRYSVVMDYEQRPSLPPPFVVLSYPFLIYRWCKRCIKGQPRVFGGGLKLFLDEEGLERLRDFEEECMEYLALEKEEKVRSSREEQNRISYEQYEKLHLRSEALLSSKQLILEHLCRLEHIISTITNDKDNVGSLSSAIKNPLRFDTRLYSNRKPDEADLQPQVTVAELEKLNRISEAAHRVRYVSEMSFDEESDDSTDNVQDSDRSRHSSIKRKYRHKSGSSVNEVIPEHSPVPSISSFPSRHRLSHMKSCPSSCEHKPDKEFSFQSGGFPMRGCSSERVQAVNITQPIPGTSNYDLLRQAQQELRSLADELNDSKNRLFVPFFHYPSIETTRRGVVEAEDMHLRIAEGEDYNLLEGIIVQRLSESESPKPGVQDAISDGKDNLSESDEEIHEENMKTRLPDPDSGLSLPVGQTVVSFVSTRPRKRTISISMIQKQASVMGENTELESLAMDVLEKGLDETDSPF